MPHLSDLVDTSALEELRKQLVLDQDPMFLNRKKFIEYCEALAQDRAERQHELDHIRTELYKLDQQWRKHAKAIAINRRKDKQA